MLRTIGVLSQRDLADIERGMGQILDEIATGRFAWSLELEDVHLNIEKRLTDLVGEAGKRLHTGRSRNDQVATDVRLWLRAAIDEIDALIRALQATTGRAGGPARRDGRCPASPICRSRSR